MNDYDTPEIRCSLRNLSRVTECCPYKHDLTSWRINNKQDKKIFVLVAFHILEFIYNIIQPTNRLNMIFLNCALNVYIMFIKSTPKMYERKGMR